jgi:hypothetical protein
MCDERVSARERWGRAESEKVREKRRERERMRISECVTRERHIYRDTLDNRLLENFARIFLSHDEAETALLWSHFLPERWTTAKPNIMKWLVLQPFPNAANYTCDRCHKSFYNCK